MDHDRQHNAAGQTTDSESDPSQLLSRLTGLGIREIDAAELILTCPDRRLARTIDAFEVLDGDRDADAHTWIAGAVQQPEQVEAALGRRQGWDAWHRMHREWDAADAAHAEQERRSHGWGAAVSEALDDDQLLHATAQVTGPIGVLGRRPVPVARAQILAWAVAVHTASPDLPLHQSLAADLDGPTTAPDPLDGGLPEPPASGPRSEDDLTERLAVAIERLPNPEPEPSRQPERPPARVPERAVERVLERGV